MKIRTETKKRYWPTKQDILDHTKSKTISEAAEKLGVKRPTIYDWIKLGISEEKFEKHFKGE